MIGDFANWQHDTLSLSSWKYHASSRIESAKTHYGTDCDPAHSPADAACASLRFGGPSTAKPAATRSRRRNTEAVGKLMSVEADSGITGFVFDASGSQLTWTLTWPGVLPPREIFLSA